MNEFWINFSANLASDTLLAFAIYFIVTQPGEKRKYVARRNNALCLVKAEAEINEENMDMLEPADALYLIKESGADEATAKQAKKNSAKT